MRRLYRIYYSVFDDNVHREILKELKQKYDSTVVDHPSRVLPDFRFVELHLDRPGLEEEIREFVRARLSVSSVKVDWIDASG